MQHKDENFYEKNFFSKKSNSFIIIVVVVVDAHRLCTGSRGAPRWKRGLCLDAMLTGSIAQNAWAKAPHFKTVSHITNKSIIITMGALETAAHNELLHILRIFLSK